MVVMVVMVVTNKGSPNAPGYEQCAHRDAACITGGVAVPG